MPQDRAPQTVAAVNGIAADRTFGAVAPPVCLSSAFTFTAFDQARDYDYTRTGNSSRCMLADTVDRLEVGAGGVVVVPPATMTHASMRSDAWRVAGIGGTLLRLSVGLEAEVDLVNGLRRGFSVMSAKEDRTP